MSLSFADDVSLNLLQRMKEGGFDFARFHPIDFFAIFADEGKARIAADQFHGESLNAQVMLHEEGGWHLQVSKVMFATHATINDFESDLEAVVAPLGGQLDGWGVTQEVSRSSA
ncbi:MULTISPECIES: ribonuclease E inhibitor RraB [Pseudomonas]|uniref:Superfamily II DNA/RNA helicase, SNF2 family protein n=1 Tax=Pseudomonas oryzihabitans TaxID=47885 RepID=A0A2Z5ACP0_9PSED|nr:MULTISPECIES: ribonuclease E inhibitor RraB [Pseudomonas]AXA67642.1 superfamily II DNA/RNA helicase, SNF2 family protein [Pseudomonas oryzihabitans]